MTVIMMVSCATTKETRAYRKIIDGDWKLQTITTEGITGKFNVLLFNEQELPCLVESDWHFNSANSLGTYTTTKFGNQCLAVKRNIRWSVYEVKNEPQLLQFKRLDDKLNPMDGGAGYRFIISLLDKTNMLLKTYISFENKPAWVIYNFVKQ